MAEIPEQWGVIHTQGRNIWVSITDFERILHLWTTAIAEATTEGKPFVSVIEVMELGSGEAYHVPTLHITGMRVQTKASTLAMEEFTVAWRQFTSTLPKIPE